MEKYNSKSNEKFASLAISATKTACIYGAVRGFILTPLIEVPFTNLERRRQLHLQIHKNWPLPGSKLFINEIKSKNASNLFTGVSTNITKNFLRELFKSYTWLSVPLISGHFLNSKDPHNCNVTKVASISAVIFMNGTMNSIFDRIRNMQIDCANLSNKKIGSFQATSDILKSEGLRGFFKGASSTYLYSFLFWGSFSASRHYFSARMKIMGLDPDSKFQNQCLLNSMCGFITGVITMPLEHIRYQIIGQTDMPSGVVASFREFHKIHYPKLGVKSYFCGLSQSLPIQISAGLLAGTLLYMDKNKASEKSKNL